MEIQKIFSDYEGEEKLYSVLMNEEELALYQEMFSDEEEKLNMGDRIANAFDKNPLTIKALRKIQRDIYSNDRETQKKAVKKKAKIDAAVGGGLGAGIGAIIGHGAGGKKGAALGSLLGAAGGAISTGVGSYVGGRLGTKAQHALRKSGGGGVYDDRIAREADRLAMLDGEMSKAEFKKKWYRNKEAR